MPDSRYRSSRRSRSRSGSPSGGESGKRLHIADLDSSVTRRDVEDAYGKFGRLSDVWVASYPPYYGFVVYERSDDAQAALKEMKRGYVGKCPVRTTVALPRGSRRPRSPPRRGFRSDRFRGDSRERRFDRYDRDDRRPRRDDDDRRSRRERSRSPRYSYRRSPDSPRKRDRSPEPDNVSDWREKLAKI